MYHRSRFLSALVISCVVAGSAVLPGCAARVYDSGSGQYHTWNHQEDARYRQWEGSTNRQHADYDKRPAEEQKAYWSYRQSQPDGGNGTK